MADLEGFLGFRPNPPLRFQEASRNVQDALKLKYLEGGATPLFHSWGIIVPGKWAQCVRVGVLLLTKFYLLCSEVLTKGGWRPFFFNQFWAEHFRNLHLKIPLQNLPWSHEAALLQIVTYAVGKKGMVQENKGEQRLPLVELWCKHWSFSSWRKGISPDEATLNSEEIKPIALVVIELCLCLKASVSQIVSQ